MKEILVTQRKLCYTIRAGKKISARILFAGVRKRPKHCKLCLRNIREVSEKYQISVPGRNDETMLGSVAVMRQKRGSSMRTEDSVTKEYMKQNTIFADAFNFFLYGGKQVIDPARLRPQDPTETGIIHHTEEKQEQPEAVQKHRDILKSVSVMTDGTASYLILGIENQDKIHYAMPVRNALYDALQYAGQVTKTAQKHRAEKDWKGKKNDEFLSGFYREDRLIPVITLVIYFQPTPWDGPRTLYEMFGEQPPEVMKYVSDYRMHLIEPAALSEDELSQFHSELGTVLKFLKHANEKEKLERLVEEDPAYQRVSREGADVISVCAGIRMEESEESEVVNVCKAVDDMIKEAVEKAVDKKETEMNAGFQEAVETGNPRTCKAIRDMIKEAVDKKAAEMEADFREAIETRNPQKSKVVQDIVEKAVEKKKAEMNADFQEAERKREVALQQMKQLLISMYCEERGYTKEEAEREVERQIAATEK